MDSQFIQYSTRGDIPNEIDLVSIVMPTYNRAHIISGSIKSVVDQSAPHWELLIIDDGSTDDTEVQIRKFNDSRIKYTKFDVNQGVSNARNAALEQAKGEYIAYLDSDNRMHKDFLTVMIHELRSNPEFDCAYCAQQVLKSRRTLHGNTERPAYIRRGPFNRSLLENSSYLDLNCFVHKRALYETHGGFDESINRHEDWDLILRYTQDACPLNVDVILSYYVFSKANKQLSRSVGDPKTHLMVRNKLSARYIDHAALGISEQAFEVTRPRNSIRKRIYDWLIGGDKRLFNRLGKKRLESPARKVTIVIPSYNVLNYLELCVRSIETYTDKAFYDLIIVDNNSDKNVQRYLKELEGAGKSKIIRNSANLGFTAAVNQGIEASGPDTDIVLMNNDAMVTEGWLEALQEVFVHFKDAGLVAPRQVLPPHTRTMRTHVPSCWPSNELDVNLSAHHKNILDPTLDRLRGFVELSFVPFFCVYITRDCINKVGLLDEKQGRHYWSDNKYCDELRNKHQLRIVYTPHSKVYHFLQKSTKVLKRKDKSEYGTLFKNT